ncbi:MAG: hypothetical protein PARBA_01531 [Parabacteroides sp.]
MSTEEELIQKVKKQKKIIVVLTIYVILSLFIQLYNMFA